MTLTRDSIAQSLYYELGIARTYASRCVEFVLEKVKETLAGGEDVLISGFGKFSVNSKGSRRGRNPATGENLVLDARKVVTFRCSPVLRRKINRVTEDPRGTEEDDVDPSIKTKISIPPSGYIYILTSPSFPGLVKVAKDRMDPSERVRDDDPDSVRVPFGFKVEYCSLFSNMIVAEKLARQSLKAYRRNDGFFKIDVSTAIGLIEDTGVPFNRITFMQEHSMSSSEEKSWQTQSERSLRSGYFGDPGHLNSHKINSEKMIQGRFPTHSERNLESGYLGGTDQTRRHRDVSTRNKKH